MATFNKVHAFVEHLAEKVHNLGSDQLMVALSNTDPTTDNGGVNASTAAGVLATVTQISYTNLSTRNITTDTSAQTSGTYKLVLTDLVLTSTGGPTGPFRYVYIYNDTPTSPADPLIGWYDYGAGGLTLADGETLTLDFDGTNGVLTLA